MFKITQKTQKITLKIKFFFFVLKSLPPKNIFQCSVVNIFLVSRNHMVFSVGVYSIKICLSEITKAFPKPLSYREIK